MNTNNTSNPPFRINQRVVCVDASNNDSLILPPLKKNNEYTIKGIGKYCCGWRVDVGLYTNATAIRCNTCGRITPKLINESHWVSSKRFAPIEENKERIRYVAVSETLREKAEEVVVQSCTLS